MRDGISMAVAAPTAFAAPVFSVEQAVGATVSRGASILAFDARRRPSPAVCGKTDRFLYPFLKVR